MSSVGSSGNDEVVRRNREEYQTREAEGTKKRKREARAQTEQHTKEVQQLKADHAKQMDDLRNRSRQALTSKDQEYQSQIKDVKRTYQEQMRNKMEEANSEIDRTNEFAKAKIEKEKTINRAQIDHLKNQGSAEIDQKTKVFSENINNAREEVKNTLIERQEKMQKIHAKELDSVRQDRDERIMVLQKNLQETRINKDDTISDLKRMSYSDKERMSDAMKEAVLKERVVADQALTSRDLLLKGEREKAKDKFGQKMEELTKQNGEIREQLKQDVVGRMNHSLRSAQHDNEMLKTKVFSDQVGNKVTLETEKRNLTNAYEGRLDEMESRLKGSQEATNLQNRKNLEDLNRKNEQLLTNVNQFHESNGQILSSKMAGDRMQLEREHRNAQTAQQRNTDRRVKGVMDNYRVQEEVQSKYYADSKEAMSADYQKSLAEVRARHLKEMTALTDRMENRVHTAEQKFDETLSKVKEQYEGEIKNTKNFYESEIRKKDELYEKRIADREKALKLDSTNLEIKYEGKLVSQKEAYEKEMEKLNRRQQEEINTLIAKMNTTRKA